MQVMVKTSELEIFLEGKVQKIIRWSAIMAEKTSGWAITFLELTKGTTS